MFCPQCSIHNLEGAKFCRACGTNLEVVYLALAGRLQIPEKSSEVTSPTPKRSPQEKKRAGAQNVVQGGILLSVSLLIGLFGFVATRGRFPWLMIWTLFFGWMACWGTISLASGLAQLIGAKFTTIPSNPEEPFSFGSIQDKAIEPFPSVTDHTTRQLGQGNS
jgi:hypothetical protein